MNFRPDDSKSKTDATREILPAPTGWFSVYQLAAVRGYTESRLLEKLIRDYGSEHPDWFKEYKDTKGHKRLHVHPDLYKKFDYNEQLERDYGDV